MNPCEARLHRKPTLDEWVAICNYVWVDLDAALRLDCAVARALEEVGERWTLLVLREAFLGVRRFDAMQRNTGCARNILADRLHKLVANGILRREPTRSARAVRIPPHREGSRPLAGAGDADAVG